VTTHAPGRPRAVSGDAGAVYRGIVRFFVVPGAVIAANWAALLCAATVVGLLPGLAGAGRALADLQEHQDTAFRSVLCHARATVRRDFPVSVGSWALICAIILNGLFVPAISPSARTFMVGLLMPLIWLLLAWVSAYVAAAQDPAASRSTVTLRATYLCTSRPLRALLAPAAIIGLSPLWLLAPITIACGISVPPYLLSTLWRMGPREGPLHVSANPSSSGPQSSHGGGCNTLRREAGSRCAETTPS